MNIFKLPKRVQSRPINRYANIFSKTVTIYMNFGVFSSKFSKIPQKKTQNVTISSVTV